MKLFSACAVSFLFLILCAVPALAAPLLFNWAMNINGDIFESVAEDPLPPRH